MKPEHKIPVKDYTMSEMTEEQSGGIGSKFKDKYENVKNEAAHLRERAGEGYQHMKERVSVYGEGANEFIDAVGQYIKENPQRSAMIAASAGVGVGLVLGLLIRGRR